MGSVTPQDGLVLLKLNYNLANAKIGSYSKYLSEAKNKVKFIFIMASFTH